MRYGRLTHNGLRTMNDVARRMRTQKAYSTDPAYLERMAREEEIQGVHPASDAAAEGGSDFGRQAGKRSPQIWK